MQIVTFFINVFANKNKIIFSYLPPTTMKISDVMQEKHQNIFVEKCVINVTK